MSYSISPSPQKPAPAPRPYSPYAQNAAASPTNASPYGPPPAKRQRISPVSPQNGAWAPPPHGLPNAGPGGYGNPYGPHSAVHSPYAATPPYVQSPLQSSFNTPQPYPYHQPPSPWHSQPPTPAPQQSSPPSQQSREMMPPPPRPQREEREEKVGVEDIGDPLHGSGIDLKAEENYVYNVYNNRHHNTQETSFSSANQNTSFGSSTMSPGNSFNLLTQGTSLSGSQDAAFAGTMGQTQTEEEIELEQRRKREVAAREQAERKQHHLNNQFLQCNNVRKRMDRVARDFHVTLNMMGVFIRQPDPEPQTSVMVNGTGIEGVVASREVVKQQPSTPQPASEARPESVVNQNTPFEQLVSLVSLAAGERIRGLLDEANTLARSRRYGDHGRVVPPEFAEIAVGDGKRGEEETVAPENITGTSWDKVLGDDADGENETSTPQPQTTISFAGSLNANLRALAERDRQAEKDRIAKREARKRKAATTAAEGDPSSATPPGDNAAAPTDSTAAAVAQAAADQPKLSKKEQLRQQKEKNSSTEAQLHTSTNQTAAMMALGKKGSRYSWMTGGASAMPTNRFAKSASGTATPNSAPQQGSSGAGGAGGGGSAAVTPGAGGVGMARSASAQGQGGVKEIQWGDWRENGRKAIEMRDWVFVLERDGKEAKSLVKALGKMDG